MTHARVDDLPLRAAYTVSELARAARLQPRRLRRTLVQAGVMFLRSGRFELISLSELERKVPILWEGIKAACALGGGEEGGDS